uniref:Alpha-carbonic anhydrase domain-containing protein n=1 Tax=Globodera pallida TaxID=36090 RepID=A0A183CP18_GLOPA
MSPYPWNNANACRLEVRPPQDAGPRDDGGYNFGNVHQIEVHFGALTSPQSTMMAMFVKHFWNKFCMSPSDKLCWTLGLNLLPWTKLNKIKIVHQPKLPMHTMEAWVCPTDGFCR